MASASQAPAPAQFQAHQEPHNHPLDNLQAMFNLVLIHSARMLKEKHSGAGAGRLQYAFQRTMPAVFERFQISLDELDKDVQQAQLVLRRQLALLQADRQKREQAEAAERQRLLAVESSAKKNPPAKIEPPEPVAVAPSDSLSQAATASTTSKSVQPAQPVASPTEPKRETEEPLKPTAVASVPPTPPPPPVDDTPAATAQDSEFDFDAIFGDGMDDMKGEGDVSNNQGDLDMDTSGPDLNFTLDDSGPSLLRGLEDFAKGSDDNVTAAEQPTTDLDLDFVMPDVQDVPTTQPVEQANIAKPAEPATSQPADDANLLDTMITDDLDDLFNMDYENPEATQFDDAFFGFGES